MHRGGYDLQREDRGVAEAARAAAMPPCPWQACFIRNGSMLRRQPGGPPQVAFWHHQHGLFRQGNDKRGRSGPLPEIHFVFEILGVGLGNTLRRLRYR